MSGVATPGPGELDELDLFATPVLAERFDAIPVLDPQRLRYDPSSMVRGLLDLPVRLHRRPPG